MKVLLIGATGKIGGCVLRELLDRGHVVSVLARDPSSLADEFPDVAATAGDAFDPTVVTAAAAGQEAIISSVAMRDPAQVDRNATSLYQSIAQAASELGIRWVTLGGAGSLEVEPGVQFVDTDAIPEAFKREPLSFRAALDWLKANAPADLDWTVISPPPNIDPDGERTGVFRLGGNALMQTEGEPVARISRLDLAVAVVNELETGEHPRQRFTLAY